MVVCMKWKIPLYKIFWDEEDVKSVTETIRKGMFWAIGPNIEQFEKMVSDYIGVKYAIAFNSGTSALHAILLAYGLGEGDEVIVPSFTFIATANSVLFVGAKPVFADIEENTFGLDPKDVEEKISNNTKAIIPIHYGGLPCQIRDLKKIADEHGLLLIEDAAESIGASSNGKKVGSFGDASMFSFCGNKIITTGEGGMILTDSSEIYEKMKLLRSHGRLETENYFTSAKVMDYVMLGFNWRMSDITAALGVSQMKKLEDVIYMRRKNAEYLNQQLCDVEGIELFEEPPNHYNVYQLYTIKVVEGIEKRDALQQYLTGKGIGTKIYFNPVHLTHFYRNKLGYNGKTLLTTETISEHVLTLPMYPSLTRENMDCIVNEIKEFFSKSDERNE
jgi:dTDP-4-amino-4,6-dideoxygalactose transaminase